MSCLVADKKKAIHTEAYGSPEKLYHILKKHDLR